MFYCTYILYCVSYRGTCYIECHIEPRMNCELLLSWFQIFCYSQVDQLTAFVALPTILLLISQREILRSISPEASVNLFYRKFRVFYV
jgi:hypothetical protein